jgi:nitrite reductase (NADH) large subunit
MNQLQAVAMNEGYRWKKKLFSEQGRTQLEKLSLAPWASRRRKELLELLDQLDPKIAELTTAVEQEAQQRPEVLRLMTHPGVGSITGLIYVLVIGTPDRFPCGKQIGSYTGLIPSEDSSAGRQRLGHLSKQGNALLRYLLGEAAQAMRRQLLFPGPADDPGFDVAEMADSKVICGCKGVTKGAIIQAVHEKGISTSAQLKDCTRASTGCGSCTEVCGQLLKAVSPKFQEESKKNLCKCLPFPEDKLREILRSQRLRSVQEVLEIYGNGVGCEVCKPALSYMLDMLWCGDHDEDRSARFINDRVHANIQKDGTFSVVPRIRGGVTSAAELRRIADVAEKYKVPMVKITGSQRIDLLGVRKADLPNIWADLGMPSGQAYT